jgi:hypothetical protein
MRPRRLSDQQIEEMCRALLKKQRRVSAREVAAHLQAAFGARGRWERVTAIKRRVEAECPLPLPETSSEERSSLQQRLRIAEERAQRAEEREVQHQDYWATRYAEKLEELGRMHATQMQVATRSASERYLRVYQWAASLAERLSRYETVEPLASEARGGSSGS